MFTREVVLWCERASAYLCRSVKYFRSVPGIAYETGVSLVERGVLTPDARLSNGAPLFLVSAESIAAARERIRQDRVNVGRSRHKFKLITL